MQGLLSSLKRYFAFGFLMLVLVVLLWLRLFIVPKIPKDYPTITVTPSIQPPKEIVSEVPIIKQSPTVLDSPSRRFNYFGPDLSVPSQLPVFSAAGPTTVNLSQASLFAEKFGFFEKPHLEEKGSQGAPFYLWQEENGKRVFSIGGSFPAIQYNNYNFLNNSNNPIKLSDEELINKAREEISKISLNYVDFDSASFTYFKTIAPESLPEEVHLNEIDLKEEASFVGISLTYKIDGYPVITNSPGNVPISLIFDNRGNLYELSAYLFNPVKTATNLKTASFATVSKSLKEKGVIFYALSKEYINQEGIPLYELAAINLSSVSINYFLPTDYADNIYPYYVFRGTSQDEKTGVVVEVIVLLPV